MNMSNKNWYMPFYMPQFCSKRRVVPNVESNAIQAQDSSFLLWQNPHVSLPQASQRIPNMQIVTICIGAHWCRWSVHLRCMRTDSTLKETNAKPKTSKDFINQISMPTNVNLYTFVLPDAPKAIRMRTICRYRIHQYTFRTENRLNCNWLNALLPGV